MALNPIVSPIDGKVVYEYEMLGGAAARARIAKAAEAQGLWAGTKLEERCALLERFLDAYAAEIDGNALEITQMMGKPLAQARAEFESTVCERVRTLISLAPQALAERNLAPENGLSRRVVRDPVGVVLDIAAWNYPLAVAINVIAPAVLAGNAVSIKHAPQTALVARQFERAFASAGAPEGLVHSLMIEHELVGELLDERRFGAASFTGSVRGGHQVAAALARRNFIPQGFELGGKDPALVLADCDFDSCVASLVDGAFYNAGQSCCAVERIYVERSIYDRFVEAYRSTLMAYRIGDPRESGTTMGPLVSAASASRVRAQVEQALARGGKRLVDARRFELPDSSAAFMAPELVVDAPMDCGLWTEETFGPAIAIAPIDDLERGIELMNDSPYGLTASLWTQDLDRAASLAPRIEAGTVFANRCDYLDPAMPWTGVKDSGCGVSLGLEGFAQVTRAKNYHFRAI